MLSRTQSNRYLWSIVLKKEACGFFFLNKENILKQEKWQPTNIHIYMCSRMCVPVFG